MRGMDETTLQLLEKLDEQIELQRESNQLLGEVLNSLDRLHHAAGPSAGPRVLLDAKAPEPAKPAAPADLEAFKGAFQGSTQDLVALYEATKPFVPKCQAPQGWVRVSVKLPSEEAWRAQLEKGCPCGGRITLKEANGASFYSCEKVTKGGCSYRPAAHLDKLAFLFNLPPSKG